ncbi:MAG: alpha/beta hydrolase [Polyangiaceae bacterium]
MNTLAHVATSEDPVRRVLSEANYVESADGTSIAYYATRPPARGARAGEPRTVVLASGLGAPRLAWRSLIDYLGDRYRFITWDYRGLYNSARPENDSAPGTYAMEKQVEDLRAVLAKENVQRAALVGWSMGVQVCLEAARRMPELPAVLVLLNGTFGRPLDTLAPSRVSRWALSHALGWVERHGASLEPAIRRASSQPEFVPWLKRMGLMADSLDEAEFGEVVQMFGDLDLRAFARTLAALGEHDASGILEHIDVPSLVITGDRDRMTPRGLSQTMRRSIPKAELLVVRGGTHYTAVEFPELVALRLERFFHENGF